MIMWQLPLHDLTARSPWDMTQCPAQKMQLSQTMPIVNVYHHFILRAAWLLCPLLCTCNRSSPSAAVVWDDKTQLLLDVEECLLTSVYHSQANGLVEWLHHILKAVLRSQLQTPSWLDELPWVLLGLWISAALCSIFCCIICLLLSKLVQHSPQHLVSLLWLSITTVEGLMSPICSWT